MGRNRDEEQFFKDLGATAEQTAEEVRGFEENYFSVIQSTMAALPWFAELNKKLQSYAEEHFAAGLECSHKLSQAKDFPDFVQIQIEFFQKRIQSLCEQTIDFSETYSKSAVKCD